MVAVKQVNNQTEEEHQYTFQTDLGLRKSVSNDENEYFISKESGESQNISGCIIIQIGFVIVHLRYSHGYIL